MVSCLILLVSTEARAEPVVSVEGSVGVGTPTGWTGAEVLVTPVRPLVLHGGAGLGSVGIQFAAGARWRFALERERSDFELGASWSTGTVAIVPDAQYIPVTDRAHAPAFYWHHAHLVNLDVAWSTVFHDWRIRPFIGAGWIVNGNDAIGVNTTPCPYRTSCARDDARFVPNLGIAFSHGVF